MDMSQIQGVILLIILAASIAAMFSGEKQHKKSKEALTMAEDDMVDQTEKPSIAHRVSEGFAGLDIKKNAEGLVESIKGIPLSVVPTSTIGEMTKAIREYTANKTAGVKMSFAAASALAADIMKLRHAKKAVPPAEPEPEGKGKTDLNAA